jgi:hypothetical protein
LGIFDLPVFHPSLQLRQRDTRHPRFRDLRPGKALYHKNTIFHLLSYLSQATAPLTNIHLEVAGRE